MLLILIFLAILLFIGALVLSLGVALDGWSPDAPDPNAEPDDDPGQN